jgi:transketolase
MQNSPQDITSDFIVKAANVVRGLSMDGVQQANSGHPGLPMGAADIATVLWTQYLKHNPKDPNWADRDRFILSGGHGSMLLYSLLHLTGYDVSVDDLKDFRQWHSKTPGHPEYGDTPGVETTTGPLGQGISNGVGFALAEASLAARYNEPEYNVVDHFTYVIATDGDLQEGVSHEACAFAGHNKLGKLVVLYDDNDITIDGKTSLSFTEDVLMRFKAYGWHIQSINGHNPKEISDAIMAAKMASDKPSIIACKTIIGKGSPNKQNTSGVHGSPLGADEIKLAKKALGIPEDEEFYEPEDVMSYFGKAIASGARLQAEWNELFARYESEHPQKAAEYMSLDNIDVNGLAIEPFNTGDSKATRSASGAVLNQIAGQIPALVGGSADLTPSNNTFPSSEEAFSPENLTGRYIHYGIREHGMGAIMNGMTLHGGVVPYAGTFFVFTDYMRPAMRMAALMGIRVIYVLTHDSIGLGEDGPTHQPIAHLASLRAMPNITVFRPADANETIIGWQQALKNENGPTCLVLTRQNLPVLDSKDVADAAKGGYVLVDDEGFEAIIIATGSEVEIAMEAKQKLNEQGKKVRVVSMPSTELFDAQSDDYKESVLPASCEARVAIEAGATLGWYKYVGLKGGVVGIDRFGASAPYKEIYERLGITSENLVKEVNSLL